MPPAAPSWPPAHERGRPGRALGDHGARSPQVGPLASGGPVSARRPQEVPLVAHSASSNPSGARSTTRAEEPSVGALVQSAMADVSTLIRSEIELAKAEVGKSAKKAGIGVGALDRKSVV